MATFLSLLVYCFFGEIVATANFSVTNALYDTKWYRFSYEQKRHMILAMIKSQQPFYFSGYNIINASLENLAAVKIT